VLWDPILDGRNYLEELSASHQEWLDRRAKAGWDPPEQDDESPQVLGFPLTNEIRDTLEKIELLKLSERPARNVLVINAEDGEHTKRFKEHLRFLECDVEYSCLPEAKIWLHLTMDQKLMPTQILAQIIAWLAKKNQ